MESLNVPEEARMQILLADDNPPFRDMLHKMLVEWGYEVTLAENGELLRSENGPRLALLDWMMPCMEGAEVCRRLRAAGTDRYIYTVLLSVRDHIDDIVAGMDSGADDYIIKPFDTDELGARLRAGRRVLALQDELVAARETLREQAMRDALTGIWNRRAILEILQNELARSRRTGQPVTLLMADLDGFKQVNDQFGHLAGDGVLRRAAELMHASVRRYDSVGRYGGEEFLIVLPACELSGGLAQADRIRCAIAAESFGIADAQLRLTCSLGAVSVAPTDLTTTDEVVREADAALYCAKHLGRNRVEVR